MDQIASMTPGDIRTTLPVIFDALYSQNLMAQLEGALALNAVSIRSDGSTLLSSKTDEILGLLQNKEERWRMRSLRIANA
ncbi:MAG: hypothetical protein M3Z09_07110 [Acidobacteriota bacterium]|nr:hypothetical protein [Acidobacteriota bacterium]